jgi:hypothetical protein
MMDAFDVWLQLSPINLIDRFEELNTSKVVLGADKACWPNALDSVSSPLFIQLTGIDEFFVVRLHASKRQSRLFLGMPSVLI